MSATLLIVGSIIVATAMILLNERLMNRSVQKSPPLPSDKKSRFDESLLFRDDKLFDTAFDRSDLGSLLSDEKLKVKKDTKANPLVATIIFLALLMGILMLLQTQ